MRASTRLAIAAATVQVLSLSAHAAIIATNAQTSITINQITPVAASASGSDSGTSAAFAAVAGPSNSSASVGLQFNSLGAETADLGFSIAWDAGTIATGSMFAPSLATITYTALADTVLDYAWDFAYGGPDPFGLQVVRIEVGGSVLHVLGDSGQVGAHAGSDSIGLTAGNTYTFGVRFNPNVSGGITSLAGTLAGDVFFRFNGATVPEAPTALLLAGGLAGLAAFKRRGRA